MEARACRLHQLSEARQRLVLAAHRVGFARVERLRIENGEPKLAGCRALATRRYGARVDARPPLLAGTVLDAAWSQLFADLDDIGDGELLLLEIAAGLPLKATVEVSMS